MEVCRFHSQPVGAVLADAVDGVDNQAAVVCSFEMLDGPLAHSCVVFSFMLMSWDDVVERELGASSRLVCGWGLLGFVGASGDRIVGRPCGFDGLEKRLCRLMVLVPVEVGFGDADDTGGDDVAADAADGFAHEYVVVVDDDANDTDEYADSADHAAADDDAGSGNGDD